MLKVPTLKVNRDRKSEDRVMELMRAWIDREARTPGVHASDLMDPLFAYMQRVHGRKLTDREVSIFLVGQVLHAFIISAVEKKQGVDFASDSGTRFSKELGISYSMDMFNGEVPREIKTSRSFYPPLDQSDIDTYLEQLLIYMAAEDKLAGQIVVLYLNMKDKKGRTSPVLCVFTVRVKQTDLDRYKKQIVTTRKALEHAIETKNPKALPLCREWKCGENYCPYFTKQCKPAGRFGLPKKEWLR